MKTLFLSVFDGLFSTCAKKNSATIKNNIFLTATNTITGRTLIIEEDNYSIWVSMLSPDNERIDFEGYLCAVANPKSLNTELLNNTKNKKEVPLPASLANQYSYIKNLKKENIEISWQCEQVNILINNSVYLIMDMYTKESFSKGLAKDSIYGKVLER